MMGSGTFPAAVALAGVALASPFSRAKTADRITCDRVLRTNRTPHDPTVRKAREIGRFALNGAPASNFLCN